MYAIEDANDLKGDLAGDMEKIDKLFNEFPELKVIEDWFRTQVGDESSKHPIKDVYDGYLLSEHRIPKEAIAVLETPSTDMIGRICAEIDIDQLSWGNNCLRYLNKIFANLKKVHGFNGLVSNLKNPEQFWDTISEMEFNAYFNKRFPIKLEPKIFYNNNEYKRLDSQITIDQRSILVEMYTPRIVKLFSWDDVPGNDNEILLRHLKNDYNISWVEDSKIRKSDDGKTICIFKDENSIEIIIDEDEKNVTLKIGDGRTHDLEAEEENGRLNIYSGDAEWFPNRAKTKLLDKLDKQIKPIKDSINEPLIIVINTSYSELDEILIKDALLGQSQLTTVKNRKTGEIVKSYWSRSQNALKDARSKASMISAILVYNRLISLSDMVFRSELILNENADYPITENESNQLQRFNLTNIR